MRNLMFPRIRMRRVFLVAACLAPIALVGQDPPSRNCYYIGFESIPGEVVQYGLPLSKQFHESHGVSFGLEGGGVPLLALVGEPVTAFYSHLGVDAPEPQAHAGQVVLTDDGTVIGGQTPGLLPEFDDPIHAVTGLIIDIDPEDQVSVLAHGIGSELLSHLEIKGGYPRTGNGLATPWSGLNRSLKFPCIEWCVAGVCKPVQMTHPPGTGYGIVQV